ncbi:DUF6085 family protein [Acrocarpospora catenulata]|uniref:DUF6085 family protein n=1 Tax=Acrocarpospora catenulata TaxID=2836182 RepID=UPI0027E001B7|nr:DUF6085 family protein [Acrocarpospora catenulata]
MRRAFPQGRSSGRLPLLGWAARTCSFIHCPRPDAVSTLLEDREVEHIVQFGAETFTVRHPLRERLDDALMECALHDHIANLDGPPVKPGQHGRVATESAGPGRRCREVLEAQAA